MKETAGITFPELLTHLLAAGWSVSHTENFTYLHKGKFKYDISGQVYGSGGLFAGNETILNLIQTLEYKINE